MNEAQVRHDLIDPALRRRVRRPADRLAPPPRIAVVRRTRRARSDEIIKEM